MYDVYIKIEEEGDTLDKLNLGPSFLFNEDLYVLGRQSVHKSLAFILYYIKI